LPIVVIDIRGVINSIIVVGIQPDPCVPVIAGAKMRILNSCDIEVPLVIGSYTDLDASNFIDH